MEEAEIPTEQLHEEMQHHAEHAPQRWIMGVALTAALLAVLAAVASLLSGHHANEAMIDQIKASDAWSYYQAKGIKAAIMDSRIDLRRALKQPVAREDAEALARYGDEQKEISAEAKQREADSSAHLQRHQIFSRAVTLFQVAIGIAAISVLTRKRRFWFVSLAFAAFGLVFLLQGLAR